MVSCCAVPRQAGLTLLKALLLLVLVNLWWVAISLALDPMGLHDNLTNYIVFAILLSTVYIQTGLRGSVGTAGRIKLALVLIVFFLFLILVHSA